jgi:hypothetical protein
MHSVETQSMFCSLPCFMLVSCLAASSILNLEAICFADASEFRRDYTAISSRKQTSSYFLVWSYRPMLLKAVFFRVPENVILESVGLLCRGIDRLQGFYPHRTTQTQKKPSHKTMPEWELNPRPVCLSKYKAITDSNRAVPLRELYKQATKLRGRRLRNSAENVTILQLEDPWSKGGSYLPL